MENYKWKMNWSLQLAVLFFFSSRRRHTRFDCDWSSDVCSSDLRPGALFGHELAPELRDRRERVVVHLAPRENRNLLVEQRDQLAQDAALRLPAQAQEDEVVAGKGGGAPPRGGGGAPAPPPPGDGRRRV